MCLASVLALAGCGGSDPAFTSESVAEQASDNMRASLAEGASIDQFECVEDGDETHWLCRTFYRDDSGDGYSVTVRYTCDATTGRCLGEPASIFPSG